ncbi:MAG: carboxymuconolactone decarboxylase family protein [Phycisphaerae bacterium]
MARLQTVDPKTAEGRAKEIFDGPLKGKHFNLFKALANSPAALDAYLGISGALSKGQLSAKELETIQLAVGQQNQCDYCLAAHTGLGKQAGLPADEIINIRKGKPVDAKLAALTKFSLALHEKRGNVNDSDIVALKNAGYHDGHIAETVAAYALATFTNYFNHVNQTEIDFPAAPAI